MEDADVICATCSSSGHPELRHFWFPFVLVDEAALANPLDILIPMIHGIQALALMGDDKQLPAIVNTYAKEMDFDISTFERICTEAATVPGAE